jgi:ArsR family transcriptional regulator
MSPKTVIIAIDTVTFAKALADETRQKIMALCCCNEMSVSQLVEATKVAQPTVSHHLKILKEAGLVTADRRGKEIFYTLNQAKLAKGCCQVAENFAPEVTLKIEI